MKDKQNKLVIQSLNIQGGGGLRKSEFNNLHQLLTSSDIFCLQETWLENQDKVDFPGSSHFRSERKKRSMTGVESFRVTSVLTFEVSVHCC